MAARPRLRRRIALCVLLGAATNLCAAWTCSALASHLRQTMRSDLILDPYVAVPTAHLAPPVHAYSASLARTPGVEIYEWSYSGLRNYVPDYSYAIALKGSPVPTWSSIQSSKARDASQVFNYFLPTTDWVAGWPMFTLRGRLTHETTSGFQGPVQCREGMLRFGDSTSWTSVGLNLRLNGHFFPLIPVCPGTIVNTLLYALAWAALLIGPREMRDRRRKRLGRCPHCAYDLRATPPDSPCPECGAPPRPKPSPPR